MKIRVFDLDDDFDVIKTWIADERTHMMWCANLIPYPLEKEKSAFLRHYVFFIYYVFIIENVVLIFIHVDAHHAVFLKFVFHVEGYFTKGE